MVPFTISRVTIPGRSTIKTYPGRRLILLIPSKLAYEDAVTKLQWKRQEYARKSTRTYHLLVNSPSTPTGPRAWILLVLIPTCWSSNILDYRSSKYHTSYLTESIVMNIPRHPDRNEPHHKTSYWHYEKQQHCKLTPPKKSTIKPY